MNSMKKIISGLGVSLLALSPVMVLAQPTDSFGQIGTLFGNITSFINNILIPFVFTLALLMFIWGMYRFFISKGEVDKQAGKDLAIYAVVAFVLMVSIWGIVNLIANGLGFGGQQIQNIPEAPSRGGR